MRRLGHETLRKFSEALLQIHAPADLMSYSGEALSALAKIIPGDCIAYNEYLPPDGFVAIVKPEVPFGLDEMFLAHIHEHASLAYLMRTGSQKAVRISDFRTGRQWRKTGLYNEFFKRLDLNYQIGCLFKAHPAQIGFSINRGDRDFTEDERSLLNLIIPHFAQAWHKAEAMTRTHEALASVGIIECDAQGRIIFSTEKGMRLLNRYFSRPALQQNSLPDPLLRWLKHQNSALRSHGDQVLPPVPLLVDTGTRRLIVRMASSASNQRHQLLLEEKEATVSSKQLESLGLTPREAEVLLWVSQGKTSGEIAIILNSKTGTVNKHLEHIYNKLHVETRTAAAAIAHEILLA